MPGHMTDRRLQSMFERATTLTPQEKAILELNTQEKLTAPAIAKRLNITTKNASRILKIAKEKMESVASLNSLSKGAANVNDPR